MVLDIGSLQELAINDNALLSNFVKEFAGLFHGNNMYVTQDIAPFNEDYGVELLARYNDYLFLMAYDEHNSESQPGAIVDNMMAVHRYSSMTTPTTSLSPTTTMMGSSIRVSIQFRPSFL